MLRRLLIIFGYFCFVLAIIAFTAGLVAYGNDYTYDFATHSIIQKGHVILESLPSGVRVTEDGKLLKKKTPYQSAYKVGVHTFGLAKDGFWSWEKKLTVVAGRVSLANYVILVPKNPINTTLDSRMQITAQAVSKDHRHLAYITAGTDAGLYTLDLGNKKVVKVYTPKVATTTTPAEVLSGMSWSDDASRLLIVSSIGGKAEHRVAIIGNTGEPIELTQSFGFDLTGLQFNGSNSHLLYWVSPDGLRRLDTDAATVSGVLADKVSQFWVQPDRVLYVQQTDLGQSLWSIDNHGKKQVLIEALVESTNYSVALTHYNGADYLAIVPSKTGIATLYSGIFGDTPESKVIARNMVSVSFSPDGHLLALTSATDANVYDLEQSSLTQSFVLYSFGVQPGTLLSMTWFDNFHLLSNRSGELYWSEFDGTNLVDLGKGYGTMPGYSDADSKLVITYQPTQTGLKIVQLQIR
jgi:hypothetical protein